MQQRRPPKTCCEALTVQGDQVYPNRYHTCDFSWAKYLREDLEAEIRLLTYVGCKSEEKRKICQCLMSLMEGRNQRVSDLDFIVRADFFTRFTLTKEKGARWKVKDLI